MRHKGWLQVAFDRDLADGLNAASFAGRPLALVRRGGTLAAFEGSCPHRGADLCRGTLLAGAIRCPFHGLAIRLGEGGDGLSARELPALEVGGLVFVRAPDGVDAGFAARLAAFDADSYFVPGFALEIAAPAALVIENAFDALHFGHVHGIGNRPAFRIDDDGAALAVEGMFLLPPSPWQVAARGRRHADIPYRATAYSPTVVVTDLGGAAPYTMITATTPLAPRRCTVRLSLVVPAGADGGPPDPAACRYLLDGARRGLGEDQPIWESMAADPPFHPVPGDEPVAAFRAFCARFA